MNMNLETKIKKRYVSIKDLAEYTSLSEKILYEWSSLGRMPSIKLGRRVLFDLNDVDSLMASLKRTVSQPDKTASKIIGEINDNSL